jgi:hypothetical protein
MSEDVMREVYRVIGEEMTNEDRREALRSRVESFQNNKDLKTKGEHQQRRKCSQCGKSYLGQENSSTCGDACRKAKSRG